MIQQYPEVVVVKGRHQITRINRERRAATILGLFLPHENAFLIFEGPQTTRARIGFKQDCASRAAVGMKH
jgi:hypothetical protein